MKSKRASKSFLCLFYGTIDWNANIPNENKLNAKDLAKRIYNHWSQVVKKEVKKRLE